MSLKVALCLPRETGTVALVRHLLANTLAHFGVAEEDIKDIRLAISEACTNVIQHAHQLDEYEVEVELCEERCDLMVKNRCDAFDSSSLTRVMPDGHSPRGRGVAIMHAVMDVAEFTSHPQEGMVVHLVRNLARRG